MPSNTTASSVITSSQPICNSHSTSSTQLRSANRPSTLAQVLPIVSNLSNPNDMSSTLFQSPGISLPLSHNVGTVYETQYTLSSNQQVVFGLQSNDSFATQSIARQNSPSEKFKIHHHK